MRDTLDRDKSLIELRALLASYEDRLSRTSEATPESHAAWAHTPEPLFLVNDLAIDLRSSTLDTCPAIEAPGIVDCTKPEESEPFLFVYKVAGGVFRVHPRQSRLTAAVVGPFSGPPPSSLVATVQTAHAAAPPVRFHISTWLGEIDIGRIEARFAAGTDAGQEPRFLTMPPRHRGYIVSTDGSLSGPGSTEPVSAVGAESGWSLVLATIADPPEEIAYAWAEFSDVILHFPCDSGLEVRPLL